MTNVKRFFLVLVIVAGVALLSSGLALASTPNPNGAAGERIPHGGYGTTAGGSWTDACLQCHDVHESAGEYVLLRYKTVTDTCGSCHYLYQKNPGQLPGYANKSAPSGMAGSYGTAGISPAYNPGYGTTTTPYNPAAGDANATDNEEATLVGLNAATATPEKWNGTGTGSIGSPWTAYEDVTGAYDMNAAGHNLQRGSGTFFFNDDLATAKTADYIPGGSAFPGKPVAGLTAIKRNTKSQTVSVLDGQANEATGGLYCASCHTPHGNFGKQLLKSDNVTPVSEKLLSGSPNHVADPRWDPNQNPSVTNPQLRVDNFKTQGGRWCAQCHNKRLDSVNDLTGEVYHNHRDDYCLTCHGNYNGNDASKFSTERTLNIGDPDYSADMGDFPHTSKSYNLLSEEPDGLCINCHKAGTLP